MHTWNIARREPISKFSSGRENDPHRNALGWRASARHVRSRTPRGVSENLFGPLFSTGLFEMGPPIKLIFFNHLGLLCNKNGLVPSFRSSISFPFFSLSLSLILRAHSFLCFVSVFFFFYFIFCSPLLLTSPSAFLPCYSVMLTSAFLYSYESRASFNTRGGILFRIEGGRRKEKMGRIGFLLFNSINGSSSKIHLF